MRTPLKALLLALAIAGTLLGSIWAGGLVYWHVRITWALRAWERDAPSWILRHRWRRAIETVENAGCRALPYLVNALDRDGEPEFQSGLVDLIIRILAGPPPFSAEAVRIRTERYEAWDLDPKDTPAEREAKCARLKTWWRDHRDQCHHGWRIWSADGRCCLK
ncbi:MAG: hypothetical protein HY293_22085 [Planctomycetes bacterium]|nr:hypothetical protein [Planctomycetota bacterium]